MLDTISAGTRSSPEYHQGMNDPGRRAVHLLVLMLTGCAVPAVLEPPKLQEVLQDTAKVFPAFQEYVKRGSYGDAHQCMSMAAQKALPYEQFYAALTAFEALRRLITTSQTSELDGERRRMSVCNAEFGIQRSFGLSTLRAQEETYYLLDLTRDDVDYLREQTLAWYKHQVKRADGWNFAYPPDWTYATLSKPCARQ